MIVIAAPTAQNKPPICRLVKINLDTGIREDLEAFDNDAKIVAVSEDTIYLQTSTAQESKFYAFSLSKKEKALVYSTDPQLSKGVMFEDKLYLFEKEKNQIKKVDLITGEETLLVEAAPFVDLERTYFLNVFDRHLFYQTINKTDKRWYALSLDKGEIVELKMFYKRFGENKSAYVLAEFGDDFLITRDISLKTISLLGKGGEAYNAEAEIPIHSIIKKSDYYNAENAYTDINQLD